MEKSVTSAPIPARVAYVPSSDFAPSDTSGLRQGMKVEHPKFGYGVVVQMDTTGADRKARIQFDNFGEKTLLLSFAKLRIHN
jgi:DNA helicase-2/ATP-dependent DNA helicase PcrA